MPACAADPAGVHRLAQRVVVPLVLLGVGVGEVGDGAVEDVAGAQVRGDGDAVAGARVRARQHPGAHLGVGVPRALGHRRDVERPLAVPELAHVEVVGLAVEPGHAVPAEQDVADRLHQPLALDHAPPGVAEPAAPDEALQHGGLRLLGLQEQRVALVAAEEQQDPGAGADAADADDLARHVAVAVEVVRGPPVFRQRLPVVAEGLLHGVREARPLVALEQFPGRHEQRRVAAQPRLALHLGGEAGERAEVVLHLRARHVLGHPLGVLAPQRRDVAPDEVGVEPRVPELDGALLGHLQHRLAVGAHAVQDDRPPRRRGVAVVARRDLEARREALDVPLPRPRQRLVEVVDVEDEPPLRRLEEAEVHEVRVAAQLGREPGVGRPGQVRRHEQRAAPVEGAGRDEHAPVADGHQLRDPVGRLLLEQADRVRPAGAAPPSARARSGAPSCAPPCRGRRAPPA